MNVHESAAQGRRNLERLLAEKGAYSAHGYTVVYPTDVKVLLLLIPILVTANIVVFFWGGNQCLTT